MPRIAGKLGFQMGTLVVVCAKISIGRKVGHKNPGILVNL
jgi:hypothetical protein